MGVDTVSRGTRKRDRRIANSGLNRAFLGYGWQGSPGQGRIQDHAITPKRVLKIRALTRPGSPRFLPRTCQFRQKPSQFPGRSCQKQPVLPRGTAPTRPSVFGLVCAEDNSWDGLLHMAKNEGLFWTSRIRQGIGRGDTIPGTRFSDGGGGE